MKNVLECIHVIQSNNIFERHRGAYLTLFFFNLVGYLNKIKLQLLFLHSVFLSYFLNISLEYEQYKIDMAPISK